MDRKVRGNLHPAVALAALIPFDTDVGARLVAAMADAQDKLFRLVAEGYIHPKVHPVAAIYHDAELYPFVFPFIYTAILRKLAEAISKENLEAVKLLEQWIEPFGTLFRDASMSLLFFSAISIASSSDNES